jgi:hypothetical protein
MSVPVRIAGFAALLVAVFAIASVAGAELDPSVEESEPAHEEADEPTGGYESESSAEPSGGEALPGLAVAEGGYRLVPEQTMLARGSNTYRFRIVDADGETVEDFELEQNRRMHLIVVRRDFAGFQHLHPRQLVDGSWEVDIELSEGGVYRAFADFETAGQTLTLATDLFVAGSFEPEPFPAVAPTADAGDGYEVSLASAPPRAGDTTDVEFTVSRNGRPVGAVEPYLGADGHLVALREYDQAYLHTHPEGEPGGPGPITFGVEYPSPGRYRLFLQFRHGGEVRTAAFTQEVEGSALDTEETEEAEETTDDH